MKKRIFWTLISLTLTFSLFGKPALAKVTLSDTVVYTFPLENNGELSVSDVNGNISIRGWDRDSARVTVEKVVTASQRKIAKRYLRDIKVNFDSDNSHLTIEPKFPKGVNGNRNFFDWIFGTGEHVGAKVNFLILVPKKIYAEAENVNGRIDVKYLTGELDIKCTNGRVTLEDVTGEISSKTVNGRIRATISDARNLQTLDLKTVNGSVSVWLPQNVGGRVDLSTMNGGISTDFPLEMQGKMLRHNVRGRLGKGHARIRINTLNGSIHLFKKHIGREEE